MDTELELRLLAHVVSVGRFYSRIKAGFLGASLETSGSLWTRVLMSGHSDGVTVGCVGSAG